MFLIRVILGNHVDEFSANLTGIEFRPKSMLQVWNDLPNALQKKPKTLMELENIAVGMGRRVAAKEVEYNLEMIRKFDRCRWARSKCIFNNKSFHQLSSTTINSNLKYE